MSTMRVTNLKHENSASNNIVLNSDGSVGGDLGTTLASKLDLAGGKILQLVQGTNVGNINTTSTSYVDANISVSITPQSTTSGILLIWVGNSSAPTGDYMDLQITDSSNNGVSSISVQGATTSITSLYTNFVCVGYVFPATTSAVTYKGRYKAQAGTASIQSGSGRTGRLFAIEVSA